MQIIFENGLSEKQQSTINILSLSSGYKDSKGTFVHYAIEFDQRTLKSLLKRRLIESDYSLGDHLGIKLTDDGKQFIDYDA